MNEDVKIGQVWRLKKGKAGITDKICVVGLSTENMIFVSGTNDAIDPEWTRQYLWNNYELDHDYGSCMNEKDYYTIKAMRNWGGSFVQTLAELASRADPINLLLIKKTWPDYWTEYEALGDKLKREEI